MMTNIDKPIARLRQKAGLTQSELAKLVDVSENTIANWERGSASKWIHNINKLCKVLGCEIEDLDSKSKHQVEFDSALSPNIKQKIESYCIAISKEEKKSAYKIASHATLHDPQLKYWLNHAEQTINQWKQNHGNQIDPDFILNSLVLQDISIKLSKTAPNKINIDKFREVTQEINLSRNFLKKYINYDKKSFRRKLLFQTKYLSVYVIGWESNQISLMHHHGNSLDAFFIIDGEMDHWLLSSEEGKGKNIPHEADLPNDYKEAQRYTNKKADKVSSANQWIYINRDQYHQIGNSSSQRCASFHVRFGSPPDDKNWEKEIIKEQPEITGQLIEQYQVMSV